MSDPSLLPNRLGIPLYHIKKQTNTKIMTINKYIIINGSPVLFAPDFIHKDMAGTNENVESAGFFLIRRDEATEQLTVICIGESTSLSIRSRPEIDQQLISNYLGLNN